MLAFDVALNGDRLCVAGSEGLSQLAMHVGILRSMRKPANPEQSPDTLIVEEVLATSVDGQEVMHPKRRVEWARRNLTLGDTLVVKIVEAGSGDLVKKVSYCEWVTYEGIGSKLPKTITLVEDPLFCHDIVRQRNEYRTREEIPRYACKVFVNGEKKCVAGVDLGHLHVGVFAQCSSKIECSENQAHDGDLSITLRVNGYLHDESRGRSLTWLEQRLTPGDEVGIGIVIAEAFDPPAHD